MTTEFEINATGLWEIHRSLKRFSSRAASPLSLIYVLTLVLNKHKNVGVSCLQRRPTATAALSHLAGPAGASAVVLQEAASILGQPLDHLQPGQVLLVGEDAQASRLQRGGHGEHVLQAAVPGHGLLADLLAVYQAQLKKNKKKKQSKIAGLPSENSDHPENDAAEG